MTPLPYNISPSEAFLFVSASLVAWYILSSVASWYRLRHIPGPFLAKFSYLWIARSTYSGDQYDIYLGLQKKYGPVVRVSPDTVMTDDPEILKRMASTKSGNFKSDSYIGTRFNPYQDPMFLTRNPYVHDREKAKLMVAYSGRDTPNLEANINDQIKAAIDLIRQKYISTPKDPRPMNMLSITGLFTLDIISRISLGKEFGCLRNDVDIHGFHESVTEHLPQIAMTTDIPWLRNIIYSRAFLRLFGPKESDQKGIGKLMKVANEIVRNRFQSEANAESQKDMLGSFIRHGLSQAQCETEALFMFVAGSDITASALRVTMLYAMSSPRVYNRLKEEIATTIREGKADSPITNSQATKLPYLQAVIYEGLRIRPGTTNLTARNSLPGGENVGGKFIPERIAVGINYGALLRNKKVFGEDAATFRPERFLEVDEATSAEMKRHTELAFGYGRWMCAGKQVAFLSLNKFYFEVLRNFDFELLEPKSAMFSKAYVTWRDRGPMVRVTESSLAQ